MNMEKHSGYYNLGSSNIEEAKNKVGVQIYLSNKPHFIRRWLVFLLLGWHWVNA